jgi:hypothetical protein
MYRIGLRGTKPDRSFHPAIRKQTTEPSSK